MHMGDPPDTLQRAESKVARNTQGRTPAQPLGASRESLSGHTAGDTGLAVTAVPTIWGGPSPSPRPPPQLQEKAGPEQRESLHFSPK